MADRTLRAAVIEAIGRLPALTTNDLAAMVAKIRAYEADFGAEWQNQGAFANDKADASGNYAASIARFTNLVQNPHSVSARANLDVETIAPARAAFSAGTRRRRSSSSSSRSKASPTWAAM